jgi:Antibiotic biosynthesis monooxygenase
MTKFQSVSCSRLQDLAALRERCDRRHFRSDSGCSAQTDVPWHCGRSSTDAGRDRRLHFDRTVRKSERPTKILSLSFWRNEEAVQQWRNTSEHRVAQHAGRTGVFADYRLRIAQVVRDYGLNERAEVPADSRAIHDHPDA